MVTPIFHLISPDRIISRRWQEAFRKESWKVLIELSCADLGPKRAGLAEIYLIEAGCPDCRGPEDLMAFLKARRPVAALVFGDAQKISNREIAAFLETGADDFVYKNIDERVLVAKIKAHIRRIMPAITEAATKLASSCRSVEIDRTRRAVKVTTGAGRYTELSNLTPKEFDILSLLVTHERDVVTRERILEKIWGSDAVDVYSECIDKHVESLRRKLGKCGKRIRTVYGSGYMFTGKGHAS